MPRPEHDISVLRPYESTEAHEANASWVRSHPYASVALGAGALLIVGALFVSTRSAVAPRNGSVSWGSDTLTVLQPGTYTPQAQPNILQNVQNNAPYTYTAPIPVQESAPDTTPKPGAYLGDSFDFDAFVELLAQGSAKRTPQQTASLPDAYAFIPGGMISTSSPTKERSESQQLLYAYGNEVGSYIESYEEQHANQAQVVKDQLEDRADPQKRAALASLGRALSGVGDSLLAIEDVPSGVATTHEALAKSYKDIGEKLVTVAGAERDADFLAAINAYNAAADVYAKQYVQLATIFGIQGVTFGPDEPGSVFVFRPVSL